MLLQKSQIGKTAVILIILTLLATLAAMPLFLQAESTGKTEADLFLPVIFNEADGTPMPTFTASPTIHPTITASATPSSTATPTPTNTPVEPYIVAIPDCGPGPNIQFNVQGYNWPTDQTLTLFWESTPQMIWQAGQHPGNFSVTWTFSNLSPGIYELTALSGISGPTFTELVAIPCEILPTNTPIPTNTPVPQPADLIVGQPQLISTPPIIVYEPVAFEVPITNTGDIAINDLFFVDLLFDPTPVHNSDVYAAVSGLGGNSSVTLTITSTVGLANYLGTHQITAWVDSLEHVNEVDETNNLSASLEIIISEPAGTPTNTPVPNGTATISGVARVFLGGSFINQERMLISAIDETSNLTVATTYSDENGFYQFDNLTDGSSYSVTACITIDNNEYFGIRTNRTAPDAFSNIFASEGTCP